MPQGVTCVLSYLSITDESSHPIEYVHKCGKRCSKATDRGLARTSGITLKQPQVHSLRLP